MMHTTILAFIFVLRVSATTSIQMPPELAGVSLGMSIEDLARLRPQAKLHSIDQVGPVEPKRLKKGFHHIEDTIPGSSDFTGVAFGIRDGHVVTIEARLICPYGSERKIRRRAISNAMKRWGEPTRKAIIADDARIGQRLAVLIWESNKQVIRLILPRDPLEDERGHTSNLVLAIKVLDLQARPPFKEMPIEKDERIAFLKLNDVH
jgi:hypothetical protein